MSPSQREARASCLETLPPDISRSIFVWISPNQMLELRLLSKSIRAALQNLTTSYSFSLANLRTSLSHPALLGIQNWKGLGAVYVAACIKLIGEKTDAIAILCGGQKPLDSPCRTHRFLMIDALEVLARREMLSFEYFRLMAALGSSSYMADMFSQRNAFPGDVADHIGKALVAACARGHLEAVETILSLGDFVIESSIHEALKLAASRNRNDVVKLLIARQPLDSIAACKRTAIWSALSTKNMDLVKLLYPLNDQMDSLPLFSRVILETAVVGDVEFLFELLKDPKVDDLENQLKQKMLSHAAAGHPNALEMLISDGRFPIFGDSDRVKDPLNSAIESKSLECIKLLIPESHGVNYHFRGNALVSAILTGNESIFQELFSHPNFSFAPEQLLSASIKAADMGMLGIMEQILSKARTGSNIVLNCLHSALAKGNLDVIKCLFQKHIPEFASSKPVPDWKSMSNAEWFELVISFITTLNDEAYGSAVVMWGNIDTSFAKRLVDHSQFTATALCYALDLACKLNFSGVVRVLLNNMATCSSMARGASAMNNIFHRLIMDGKEEILRLFLRVSGLEIPPPAFGTYMMSLACNSGHPGIVKALIEVSNMNLSAENNLILRTAGIYMQNADMVKILLTSPSMNLDLGREALLEGF
ncbi:hypothetical protein HDU67_006741 [Dinochytrium kinnereticum]|nr:hypothetical protein HDU67_006741 [Dinochytrium kinnereticum]